MEILKNFLILFLLSTPLISCKQHPERNEKMTDFISTGSTYWFPDEEIQILEKNATNGDKNSAFKLYQYHMFVSLDQDLEFKWLEIAAKNGHPIAQSNLADLFFTQGNKEKAIFWAKKATLVWPMPYWAFCLKNCRFPVGSAT